MKPLLLTVFMLGGAYAKEALPPAADGLQLVIGTHHDGLAGSSGLYSCGINAKSGALEKPRLILEEHAGRTIAGQSRDGILYSAGASKKEGGKLLAFDLRNERVVSSAALDETGSCYLSLSLDQSLLFSADIRGGSVSAFRIVPDGQLGEAVDTIAIDPADGHTKFRPHAVVPAPDGRFLFVPDIKGNRLCRLAVDLVSGQMTLDGIIVSDNFNGPRHFCFDAVGKTGYLVNQMGEAVTVFRYVPETGELKEIGHEQSLPDDQLGINNHIAEIKIHPTGKFVYVSNRGHDSLALYHRDPATGNLRFVECVGSQGQSPWSFAIEPGGKHLYCSNKKSNNIAVYSIDQNRGTLTFTGQTVSVPQPACLGIFFSSNHNK
jgi:6-phosphogluconolactonase